MRLTRVRYLPPGVITSTWIDVFNDKVLIGVLPRNEKPYGLLVRDKSLVESMRAYFNLLWKSSFK